MACVFMATVAGRSGCDGDDATVPAASSEPDGDPVCEEPLGDLTGTWHLYATLAGGEEVDWGQAVLFHDDALLTMAPKDCAMDLVMGLTGRSVTEFPHQVIGAVACDDLTIEVSFESQFDLRLVKESGLMDLNHNATMTLNGQILGEPYDLSGGACGWIYDEDDIQIVSVAIRHEHHEYSLCFFLNRDAVINQQTELLATDVRPFLEGYRIWERKNPNKDVPVDEEFDQVDAIGGTVTVNHFDRVNMEATYDLQFDSNPATFISGTMTVTGFSIDH